jgi:hypothetical protein
LPSVSWSTSQSFVSKFIYNTLLGILFLPFSVHAQTNVIYVTLLLSDLIQIRGPQNQCRSTHAVADRHTDKTRIRYSFQLLAWLIKFVSELFLELRTEHLGQVVGRSCFSVSHVEVWPGDKWPAWKFLWFSPVPPGPWWDHTLCLAGITSTLFLFQYSPVL